MNRLYTARAALVAFSAIGMVWSTPAFAANYDATAPSVYAKVDKNQPTTTPNVPPVNGPIIQAGPSDVDVTYVGVTGSNGSYQWTYEVKNIGGGSAYTVRVMKNALRNNFMGDIESDIEYQDLGLIAAGAAKTVVVSCAPKYQQPPCSSSSVNVSSSSSVDSNPGNNWDTSPNIYP